MYTVNYLEHEIDIRTRISLTIKIHTDYRGFVVKFVI